MKKIVFLLIIAILAIGIWKGCSSSSSDEQSYRGSSDVQSYGGSGNSSGEEISSFEREVLGNHRWGETKNETESVGKSTSLLGYSLGYPRTAIYNHQSNGLYRIVFYFSADEDYQQIKNSMVNELGNPSDSEERDDFARNTWTIGSVSYELEYNGPNGYDYASLEVENDRYE